MASLYQCFSCDKVFPAGQRARDNHCNATGHDTPPEAGMSECRWCGLWDDDWDVVEEHEDEEHQCRGCSDYFTERIQHERQEHPYCAGCDRVFLNWNNLQQRGFTSATGMTHHLERAACPNAPQLNRDQIYRIVRERDPSGRISKKLLTWTGTKHYIANKGSYNGDWYECHLCNREFGKLQGLNTHLNSLVHQETLYHCPNGKCGHDFKSLASLINHLESESCSFMRFDAVQRQMGNLVSSNRRLQF